MEIGTRGSDGRMRISVDVSHFQLVKVLGGVVLLSFIWPVYSVATGNAAVLFGNIPSYEIGILEDLVLVMAITGAVGFGILHISSKVGNRIGENLGVALFCSVFIVVVNIPAIAMFNRSQPDSDVLPIHVKVDSWYIAGGDGDVDVDVHYLEVTEMNEGRRSYTIVVTEELFGQLGGSYSSCLSYVLHAGNLGVDHYENAQMVSCSD